MGIHLSDLEENIEGKEEIARYEQFLSSFLNVSKAVCGKRRKRWLPLPLGNTA